MEKGILFNIQKFCINDGPGIRTTVFLKGCPLRCKWCHNPESHLCKPELLYDADNCIQCGRCGMVCLQNAHSYEGVHRIDRGKCLSCGACTDECCSAAIELAGKEMCVQEVMTEVIKDKVFYDNSGGGLTLSGGEPLMQCDFAYALLKQAKQNGIHTCVETCGYAKTEDILKIAEVTDIFLYDWKMTDDGLHKAYTGVSNGPIRENLKALDAAGTNIILRCPMIPNVNDDEAHFQGIANIVNSFKSICAVEIEPYHSLGNAKYAKLGKTEAIHCYSTPSKNQIEDWIAQIQKQVEVVVKLA